MSATKNNHLQESIREDAISLADADIAPPALALVSKALDLSTRETSRREIIHLHDRIAQLETMTLVQKATAEQARRSSDCLRGLYDRMLDALAQPVVAINTEGRVQTWNPAIESITGITKRRAFGKPVGGLLGEGISILLLDANSRAIHAAHANPTTSQAITTVNGPIELVHGVVASKVSLLTLSRVPGWVEATVALIEMVEIACPSNQLAIAA